MADLPALIDQSTDASNATTDGLFRQRQLINVMIKKFKAIRTAVIAIKLAFPTEKVDLTGISNGQVDIAGKFNDIPDTWGQFDSRQSLYATGIKTLYNAINTDIQSLARDYAELRSISDNALDQVSNSIKWIEESIDEINENGKRISTDRIQELQTGVREFNEGVAAFANTVMTEQTQYQNAVQSLIEARAALDSFIRSANDNLEVQSARYTDLDTALNDVEASLETYLDQRATKVLKEPEPSIDPFQEMQNLGAGVQDTGVIENFDANQMVKKFATDTDEEPEDVADVDDLLNSESLNDALSMLAGTSDVEDTANEVVQELAGSENPEVAQEVVAAIQPEPIVSQVASEPVEHVVVEPVTDVIPESIVVEPGVPEVQPQQEIAQTLQDQQEVANSPINQFAGETPEQHQQRVQEEAYRQEAYRQAQETMQQAFGPFQGPAPTQPAVQPAQQVNPQQVQQANYQQPVQQPVYQQPAQQQIYQQPNQVQQPMQQIYQQPYQPVQQSMVPQVARQPRAMRPKRKRHFWNFWKK